MNPYCICFFFCRLCISTEVEQRKCQLLKQAAFSRDIRPVFECVLIVDCLKAVSSQKLFSPHTFIPHIVYYIKVQENNADATVVPPKDFQRARRYNMQPVVYEELDDKNTYCALVDRNIDQSVLTKAPM